MQTVEYDDNGAVVTVMCKAGENGDVEGHLDNSGDIFIVQYDPSTGNTAVISMTSSHFADFLTAFKDIEKIRQLGKITK
jgi:hypothetical protein